MRKWCLQVLMCVFVLTAFNGQVFSEEELSLQKSEVYVPDIDAKIMTKIEIPKGYHEGILLDGKNVWIANGQDIPTWIIDLATGDMVKEIKAVGPFTEGIIPAGGGKYWVTDWDDENLYKVRIEDNVMEKENEVSFAPAHPTGVIQVNDKLYMITWTRGIGTKYHLLELDKKGHILRRVRIKEIQEPAHLTWDGERLWITSWFSKLVFKVNIEDMKIEGSFKSPVLDTTGIAWDGESFWITGTNSDLYRVKIE